MDRTVTFKYCGMKQGKDMAGEPFHYHCWDAPGVAYGETPRVSIEESKIALAKIAVFHGWAPSVDNVLFEGV